MDLLIVVEAGEAVVLEGEAVEVVLVDSAAVAVLSGEAVQAEAGKKIISFSLKLFNSFRKIGKKLNTFIKITFLKQLLRS